MTKVRIKYHPQLDFGVAIIGGEEIPTKQDKFKPLQGFDIVIDPEDKLSELSEQFDLYIKKKGKDSSEKFKKELIEDIKQNLKPEHPFPIEQHLEVYISISMDKKRLYSVDVDNIAKFVIDCMNGLVFVDDSQIVNLFVSKEINSFLPVNGIIIGVRKINTSEDSWFNNIKLLYMEEVPPEEDNTE